MVNKTVQNTARVTFTNVNVIIIRSLAGLFVKLSLLQRERDVYYFVYRSSERSQCIGYSHTNISFG